MISASKWPVERFAAEEPWPSSVRRMPSGAVRYAAGPLLRFALGDGTELLRSDLLGFEFVEASGVAAIIASCQRFDTLEEHAKSAAKLCGLPANVMPLIAKKLSDLAAQGHLLAESELLARCLDAADRRPLATANDEVGLVTTVGVMTCDRIDGLTRCATSYLRHFCDHGRDVRFVIVDDSRTPAASRLCQFALAGVGRSVGRTVEYVGCEQKFRYLKSLLRVSSCPEDIARFALFGPPGGYRPTTGANRNWLLLQTAGELSLTVDDDTVCELTQLPGGTESGRLRFCSEHPIESWYYRTRPEARAAVEPASADLLDEHEALLGAAPSGLVLRHNEQTDFSRTCSHLMTSLARGTGWVVLTMTGLLGDPGVHSNAFLLGGAEVLGGHLAANEAAYRLAMETRQVIRGARVRTVCHRGPCMAYALGIDHRGTLPPFFPAFRNQDGLFGALLSKCDPEAYIGHVPFAVLHSPDGRDTFSTIAVDDFARTRFSDLIRVCLDSCPEMSSGLARSAALRHVGNHLRALGQMPEEGFREYVSVALLRWESARCGAMERALTSNKDAPAYWRADARCALQRLEQAIATGEYLNLIDMTEPSRDDALQQAQRLLGSFGELLLYWPELVEAAKELRRGGKQPAIEVTSD